MEVNPGSQPEPEPDPKPETKVSATIDLSDDGVSYVEAEKIDLSTIQMREDQNSLTEAWNNDLGSGECLKGFVSGTTITIKINADKAMKVALGMRMSFYNGKYDMANLEISIDGQTLTATSDSEFGHQDAGDYWRWGDVSFGTVDLTAGEHVLTITFKTASVNIDRFEFDVNPSATEQA